MASFALISKKVKISIGEGKDIHIELPLSGAGQQAGIPSDGNVSDQSATSSLVSADNAASGKSPASEPKLIRSLTRKQYKITEVKRGPETRIDGTVLWLRIPPLM